jgi:hypothetical protein
MEDKVCIASAERTQNFTLVHGPSKPVSDLV